MSTRRTALAIALVVATALVVGRIVGVSQAPAPRAVALVITGGTVVTMDAARRILTPGAVAIDRDQIVAVDTPDRIQAGYVGAETIDAAGHVVIPGLINTHTH